MNHAPQLPATAKYSLKILNGPKKGTKFNIAAPEVRIGRSSDNDISFDYDVKCSRNHALMVFGPHGYELKSLSNKNPVIINGQPAEHALLQKGAKIKIGETELYFDIEVMTPPTQKQMDVQQGHGLPGMPQNKRTKNKSKRKTQKKSPLFKIIVGLLVLFFVWILTSESNNKDEEIGITTSSDVETEINEANRIKKAKQEDIQANSKNTAQYQDAQSNYVRGFRDYQKGQFGRARDAFQTCLSLYPGHVLCQRYYQLSSRKFSELIQQYLILGRDYQDRNQFSACMNSLKSAMVMIKDKNDEKFKQARALHDACEAQIGARY